MNAHKSSCSGSRRSTTVSRPRRPKQNGPCTAKTVQVGGLLACASVASRSTQCCPSGARGSSLGPAGPATPPLSTKGNPAPLSSTSLPAWRRFSSNTTMSALLKDSRSGLAAFRSLPNPEACPNKPTIFDDTPFRRRVRFSNGLVM